MERFFNTSGPCDPDRHYMLSPGQRLGRVRQLVEEGRYFTLAAGRQFGKTTLAQWFVGELNSSGRFAAAWVDLENARDKPDPAQAMPVVLDRIDDALRLDCPGLPRPKLDFGPSFLPDTAVQKYVEEVCAASKLPVVLLLDEADALVGRTMVSFLTQLRAGYLRRRQAPFPACVALIGQRRVRDYALSVEDRRAVAWLGSTSPFNIEAEALTLNVFSGEEVTELLAQHTAETGQPFRPEAIERIQHLSAGHPWLVNALAYEPTRRDVIDRSVAITAEHVDLGRDRIVRERRTNIASLEDRLTEDRVRGVLEPMITGRPLGNVPDADVEYSVALGLVRRQPGGGLTVANPIYREVILRQLSMSPLSTAGVQPVTWLRPDGSLDLRKLLDAFLAFWRRHGAVLMGSVPYHEAAPHLVMMAFLHRVENGGGRLERKYAVGTGRLDLMLQHGSDRFAFELKVWREEDDSDPVREGLGQLDTRLSDLGLDTGWLVIFDRRPGLPRLSERTSAETARTPSGREVTVVRA